MDERMAKLLGGLCVFILFDCNNKAYFNNIKSFIGTNSEMDEYTIFANLGFSYYSVNPQAEWR